MFLKLLSVNLLFINSNLVFLNFIQGLPTVLCLHMFVLFSFFDLRSLEQSAFTPSPLAQTLDYCQLLLIYLVLCAVLLLQLNYCLQPQFFIFFTGDVCGIRYASTLGFFLFIFSLIGSQLFLDYFDITNNTLHS